MAIKGQKIVDRDYVISKIGDEIIFRNYLPFDLQLGVSFNSPLREDNVPSFALFRGAETIMYKDFATGQSGDCFQFVAKLYGISYMDAVYKVAADFSLLDEKIDLKAVTPKAKSVKKSKEKVKLGVRFRKWDKKRLEYWTQFGIKPETLDKYRVHPVSHVFFNGYPRSLNFAFTYIEEKDGILTYKIYQPYQDRVNKWINNNDYSVWEGWSQLPETGDTLIWTKSRKDLMSIYDTTGIPTVACQAESITPKEHIVEQLRSRFKRIILFYDNDYDKKENWGLEHAKRLSEEFNLPYIVIPDEYQLKDYSDFVKQHGAQKAKQLLLTLISN